MRHTPQRGQCLHLIVGGGRTVDDQGCATVAPQRLLEHAGELGVAIRDVGGLGVRQGVDDVAKRRQ